MSTYFEKSQNTDLKGEGGSTIMVNVDIKNPFFLTASLGLSFASLFVVHLETKQVNKTNENKSSKKRPMPDEDGMRVQHLLPKHNFRIWHKTINRMDSTQPSQPFAGI